MSGAASDPQPGEYGTRARTLEPNSEMAVAELDGKVYVLGGYPASRVTQNTLQIYDTRTDSWSIGAPAPIPLHHPVTAGVNGKLYSLGGQPDTDRTFEYDPRANAWRELRRMPTARGGGAAAVIGQRIYVVGGRPPAANAFEVYDVGSDTWAVLPPLPQRINNRNHLAAVAIAGRIYVAGGRYNGGGVGDPRTDSLDMYDPQTNTWSARRPMLRPRGGVAGVAARGCFHVYGGEGTGIGEPNNVFPDHDVYNPTTDTWTPLKRLPVPFHGVTGGAFVDGLIFMPGGGTSSGGESGGTQHQVYRPAAACEP
jgi:N-acetylneuraminic acid mutarotase